MQKQSLVLSADYKTSGSVKIWEKPEIWTAKLFQVVDTFQN